MSDKVFQEFTMKDGRRVVLLEPRARDIATKAAMSQKTSKPSSSKPGKGLEVQRDIRK